MKDVDINTPEITPASDPIKDAENKDIEILKKDYDNLKKNFESMEVQYKKVAEERDNLHKDILNKNVEKEEKTLSEYVKENW